MNKILLFVSIILSLGSFSGFTQEIHFSNPEKFSFQNGDFSVVGWSGDRLYTYRASREGYFLNGYDDSMRLRAQVSLDFFPQKIYDTKFINYPDKILVFFQAVQSNNVVQYVARLDEKGLLQGRPLSLGSAKTGWFANKKQYFTLAVSEDRSRIMILGWGGKNNVFSTVLLDDQMKVLSRSNQNFEKGGNQNFHQSLLTNSGELLLTTFSESGSKGYSEEMSVFTLSPDSKTLKKKTWHLQDQYLSGLYSKLNIQNNQLYSAAFYSTGKSGNLEGIVYSVFDPATQQFSIEKTIPFDEKIKNSAQGKNKKRVFNDYAIKQIILKNDGGFLVISENSFVTIRSSYPTGYGFYSSYYYTPYGNNTIREYIFGDILALNFDAEGNRLWYSFIRKDQYSQEDNGTFSSFALMNSGSDIGFLYNNFTSRNSYLTFAVLNPEGKVDFTKLNVGEFKIGDWIPRAAKQTDLKEWVIPVLRGNSLAFVRLSF